MIENNDKFLIYLRLFIFVVLYMIFLEVLNVFLEDAQHTNLYTNLFLFCLVIDIIFHIIFIIKDFSKLKLFIIIQNVLIKIMYIVISLLVVFTTYYTDSNMSQAFMGVVILGMISYPIFIILLLLDTYKSEDIVVNKSVLLILINGLVVYFMGFLINTEYESDYFEDVYLENFEYGYGMSLVYIPIVVAVIIYVISLFESKREVIEK